MLIYLRSDVFFNSNIQQQYIHSSYHMIFFISCDLYSWFLSLWCVFMLSLVRVGQKVASVVCSCWMSNTTYYGSNYVQNSSQIILMSGMESFLANQHFATLSCTLSLQLGWNVDPSSLMLCLLRCCIVLHTCLCQKLSFKGFD